MSLEPGLTLSQTVPDSVYAFIRREILLGLHAPGAALKQDDIAQRLGVSKIPLREALSRLESEGMVVLKPRRGYFVAAFDVAEIDEIFELRATLEELAGRLAAKNHSPGAAVQVQKLADEMAALDPKSATYHHEWCNLNREFHEAIIAASGKKHVIRIAMQLRHVIEPYIRLDTSMSVNDPAADDEHRGIAAALAARDADLVGALCGAHCFHTRDRLISSIQGKLGAKTL